MHGPYNLKVWHDRASEQRHLRKAAKFGCGKTPLANSCSVDTYFTFLFKPLLHQCHTPLACGQEALISDRRGWWHTFYTFKSSRCASTVGMTTSSHEPWIWSSRECGSILHSTHRWLRWMEVGRTYHWSDQEKKTVVLTHTMLFLLSVIYLHSCAKDLRYSSPSPMLIFQRSYALIERAAKQCFCYTSHKFQKT